MAFAFSNFLYPLGHLRSLRSGYHWYGAQRVYPVDWRGEANQLGWGLSPGEGLGCCYYALPIVVRLTHHFGYGLSASLAICD